MNVAAIALSSIVILVGPILDEAEIMGGIFETSVKSVKMLLGAGCRRCLRPT